MTVGELITKAIGEIQAMEPINKKGERDFGFYARTLPDKIGNLSAYLEQLANRISGLKPHFEKRIKPSFQDELEDLKSIKEPGIAEEKRLHHLKYIKSNIVREVHSFCRACDQIDINILLEKEDQII